MKALRLDEHLSNKFRNLAFICALLVVSIHLSWWPNVRGGVVEFLQRLIQGGVACIAVPFFFCASGFFLAAHSGGCHVYMREIAKRVRTLLIPYLFWCCTYFLEGLVLILFANLLAHRPFLTGIHFGCDRIVQLFGLNLWAFPELVPLWFIRCLFLFVLVFPIFRILVSGGRIIWLLFLFVCSIAYELTCISGGFWRIGFSLTGVFYFSLGMYLRLFPWKTPSRVAASICALLGLVLVIELPFNYRAFAVPFLLTALFVIVSDKKWPEILTRASFPIFIIHYCVLLPFKVVVNDYGQFSMISLPIAWATSCCVPILIAHVLRRKLTRVSDFIFGGR